MESKKKDKKSSNYDKKLEIEDKPEKPNTISADNEMIIESSEVIEIVQSFDELNLREELLRGVYAYGFDKPSAVQKRAILPII